MQEMTLETNARIIINEGQYYIEVLDKGYKLADEKGNTIVGRDTVDTFIEALRLLGHLFDKDDLKIFKMMLTVMSDAVLYEAKFNAISDIIHKISTNCGQNKRRNK